jgi:hypothetical protein
MKTFNLLPGTLFLMLCLFACKKADLETTPAPADAQPLIAGNWSQEQETKTQYIDSVSQGPIVYMSSAANKAHILFNTDGSFVSTEKLTFPTMSTPLVTSDIISGNYIYNPSGNQLTLSTGVISCLQPIVAEYSYLPTKDDLIELISNSVRISQLTPTQLILHFELVENLHHNGTIAHYKIISDLSYSKDMEQ